jgi:DNA-binding response OmpR family regulator
MKKSITIIEDDKDINESLSTVFESDGYTVRSFLSPRAFFEAQSFSNEQCYLIDWNLPEQNGIEVAKVIRATNKISPIFLMSASREDKLLMDCLRTGADHFLYKPFDCDELLARINTANVKLNTLHAELMNVGIKLLPDSSTILKNGIPVQLTDREFAIFEQLYKENKVTRREELILKFASDSKTITPRNIDVHVSFLRKKIKSLGMSIDTVRGAGYRLNA